MRSRFVRKHECSTDECRRYGAKSPGERTGRMREVRGSVHEADKGSINELKGKEVDRSFVRDGRRMGRRQAGVASKDQIQQPTMEKREVKASQNPVQRKNPLAKLDRKKRASIIARKRKCDGSVFGIFEINRSGWKRRSEGAGTRMAAKG